MQVRYLHKCEVCGGGALKDGYAMLLLYPTWSSHLCFFLTHPSALLPCNGDIHSFST